MNEIAIAAGDNATCKPWLQHLLENAFNYVPPADTIRGIFGATPTETMDFHKSHQQTVRKMYPAELLGILHFEMPLLGLHL